jgi:hypothetical protein
MRKVLLPLLLLVTLAVPLLAQLPRGRDPLNDKEADDLREAAQEPEKRLKLMVQFARARLQSIEQLRGDASMSAGRGSQIHDLLEDFTELVDELDDNIDDFADRHMDERKGLKAVVEGATEFQLKLRALKEQSTGKEAAEYAFALQNATDAVNSDLDNARQTLAEQETEFKEAKKKKK